MSIVVIGLNHRTAPLALLERVALDGAGVAKAVTGIAARDTVREAVVLSTCNRTEVYAVVDRFHGAYDDIRDLLGDLSGVDPADLAPHLYSEHDDAAVEHLFAVATGIDSMVLGESEILGQVRDAWETARAEGASRTTLNLLLRHALEVGKRARTETAIGRGTASVSHAAVELATEHLGDLTGRTVAVVGAGSMGEGIAVALRATGVGSITVVNRSADRGRLVADRVGGDAVGLEGLAGALATSDLILTCTGAERPVITADMVRAVSTPGRDLLFVDVAVPRDVAVDVADLPGVTVLDLEGLQRFAEAGVSRRASEIDDVRRLVRAELDRFTAAATALQAAPVLAALHRRADEIRSAEIDRVAGRLDDEARRVVEEITHRIIGKLLHGPSVRLRAEVGSPRGQRSASVLVDLFDLGDVGETDVDGDTAHSAETSG
jgi:glutamyl-tRNA reductase